MKRLDEELGLKDANAEKTTAARAMAISDIRNFASFAAANHLMVAMTNFDLIINADATPCQTSGESTQKVRVFNDRKKVLTQSKCCLEKMHR